MEPNMKLLIEDLMKQVCEEIKQSREEIFINFVTRSEAINKHVSEMAAMDQGRDEWVTGLETTVAAFDKSFAAWKSEVDESLTPIKIELTKLNSFFN
jgi:hypothetical protein